MSEFKTTALTQLSEEEKAFAQAVREFAEEQIKPRVQEMDRKAQFDRDLIDKFFEMGLMGIEVPEKWGGSAGSFFMAVLAVEELARVDPSAATIVDVQNTLFINAILRWGNEDLKERYLPRLCRESVGAYALSEASSGCDAFALKTKAIQDGDGYILRGNKLWITNSAEAEVFIIMANANPDQGYKGITAFMVEKGMQSLLPRRM